MEIKNIYIKMSGMVVLLLSLVAMAEANLLSFSAANAGSVEIREVILAIVAIVVGGILVSALLPSSLNSLQTGRNTSWAAGTLSSYDSISIMAAIAGMLIFVAIVIKLVS